jgi:hypothetical protein
VGTFTNGPYARMHVSSVVATHRRPVQRTNAVHVRIPRGEAKQSHTQRGAAFNPQPPTACRCDPSPTCTANQRSPRTHPPRRGEAISHATRRRVQPRTTHRLSLRAIADQKTNPQRPATLERRGAAISVCLGRVECGSAVMKEDASEEHRDCFASPRATSGGPREVALQFGDGSQRQ